MAAEPVVDVIEQQAWLEPLGTGLQKAVSKAYEAAGPAGRTVKNVLNGTWLGHPLHPVLTDIPIGAWTTTVVLDLLDAGERREYGPGADAALKLGLAGAVCAAVTGLTDWQDTDGPARRVGVVHGLLNLTGAGLFAASWAARNRGSRCAGRTLARIGLGFSIAAAYLGGNLVYGKQIGVSHTAGEPLPRDWTPVMADSGLPEDQPRRASANDVKVLLVRHAGQIHCIAEVCSHLGGPLAEGKLEGTVIQCPWHGSRFSLQDGEVLQGPATHPQPCFETRVRAGQIEIRTRREQE
jgi:nitrite reductase/ring-hydroxylating ferredoxin subunit/uncharacterized membrane protein